MSWDMFIEIEYIIITFLVILIFFVSMFTLLIKISNRMDRMLYKISSKVDIIEDDIVSFQRVFKDEVNKDINRIYSVLEIINLDLKNKDRKSDNIQRDILEMKSKN